MNQLTNRLNLPAILVKAVQNDSYSMGSADYSTTGLLKPPRIAQLSRMHGKDLTEDVSDRIWSLFGQVTHSIIERAASDELVEKRLFMEVSGKTVSGQIDLYQGDTIWDWKTTSIYSGKDGPKEEWVQQANINRLICAKNGIEVKKLVYVALYRDWSKMAAERKGEEYPQSQVEIFNLPVWLLEKTEQFVIDRIALHEAAKVEPPLCSDDDRWAKPEKWALMKKGQKRAVKLYDTELQAEAARLNSEVSVSCEGREMKITAPKKHYIEHRPGENTRCLYYCPVSKYCSQFRNLMQEAA